MITVSGSEPYLENCEDRVTEKSPGYAGAVASAVAPAARELEEAGLSLTRLRDERLQRLQHTMQAGGMAGCVFFHPANIRYATGASMMDVFCAGTSARYCVVPATGDPILFEWEMGVPYSSKIVRDVRVAGWWQFTGTRRVEKADRMAAEIRDVLSELGLADEEVGADRLDVAALLALQRAGLRVVDASPVTDLAREVKTPEEVKVMRFNGAIGAEMMADFEAAIVDGIAEYELFAQLSDSLLRRQGEVVFSRLIASGQNTNPWGSEARGKLVRNGDLVAVDTDAVGCEGYLIDFSRTFLCGDGPPSSEAAEAYRVAHDCLLSMRAALRPGLSLREYAASVPAVPEKYLPLRYDLMVHGAGLEDEGPIIYYDGQADNSEDEYLRENMALCLECYVGAVGGSCGVKLEDQLLVTADGSELLCPYPYDSRLLGVG
jgi:Xaa-Pro dipeptidase